MTTPRLSWSWRLAPGRLVALVALAVACPLAAQSGSIVGTVLDGAANQYLEGAELRVAETGSRVLSGRNGVFVIPALPAGKATVVVNYPGLPPATEVVDVVDGRETPLSVVLGSDAILLDDFIVRGAREGMFQAIALQKASFQVKLVAAADQFGEISEGNIGEYLKFLPGVSVDYNVNDARGISLRGLSTAFTIVSVDGTPMAGASSVDDTRRFEFEQIAMNNVETTELFKTVTPDIPASATGGFVNFVTKSAFDHPDEQRVSYNVSFSAPSSELIYGRQGGVWGSGQEWVIRPAVELNFSRKLSERAGLNLNYRLSEKYDSSPRQEITWVTSPAATAGIFTTPRIQQYNIRDEQKLTHRQSFAGKFDYLVSDRTTVSVSGQWNWYDLMFTQRGLQFILGPSSTTNGTGTYTSGSSGASVNNGVLQRNKYGTTLHFSANLDHKFLNGARLAVTPYWSRADGHYEDATKGFISSAASMAFTGTNTFSLTGVMDQGVNPSISVVRGGASVPVSFLYDLGNYTFNGAGTNFQSRPWIAIDERNGVNGSYAIDLELGRLPITIKPGFALDRAERYISRPDIRGATTPALSITGDALRALADTDYARTVYGFGVPQVIDPELVWAAYASRLTAAQTTPVRFFEEEERSLFLRVDAKVTPQLTIVGGARHESREVNASGRVDRVGIDLDYSGIYPSLSFSYQPRDAIIVRGGISRTIGHPDYSDLLPTITGEGSGAQDGNMVVPDPGIEPYFSVNLDLSVDAYLPNGGVAGIALYRKDVENYIASRAMTAAELAATATAYGYNPAEFLTGTIRFNGGESTLQGFELSYLQALDFLPGFLGNFNVQANYTWVDIDSSDIDTQYSQSRAVSPRTANFIVGYRQGKFNATLTNNWVDESLYGGFVNTSFFQGSAGTSTAPDTRLALYKDEKLTTDLKLEWAFNKRFTAYFLVRNLFNTKRNEFARGYLPANAGTVLPFRSFEFGEPHLTVGFRGQF